MPFDVISYLLAKRAMRRAETAGYPPDNAKICLTPDNKLTICSSGVGTEELKDGAVTTAKIADGAVTSAKLYDPVAILSRITFSFPSQTDPGNWPADNPKQLTIYNNSNAVDLNKNSYAEIRWHGGTEEAPEYGEWYRGSVIPITIDLGQKYSDLLIYVKMYTASYYVTTYTPTTYLRIYVSEDGSSYRLRKEDSRSGESVSFTVEWSVVAEDTRYIRLQWNGSTETKLNATSRFRIYELWVAKLVEIPTIK